MALSFKSVQAAYTVFNELKREFDVPSNIPSWPEDMATWTVEQRQTPRTHVVYGCDHKSDDGWENIFFLIDRKHPKLEQIKARFEELRHVVHNSPINKIDTDNPNLWIIGWF